MIQSWEGALSSFVIGVIAVLLAALGIVYGVHAVVRHGQEAYQIRDCLENNGPVQTWRSLDKETFYIICQLDKGLFGLLAATKDGFEKTAFVRNLGTWKDTIEYLSRIATKWTQGLPWIK